MNILLCLSATPDTTAKIKFTSDGKQLDTEGMQFVINPYDDHAIASAMQLKEAHNGNLTVINVGEPDADQVIRKALAIGADQAIRVNSHPHDAYFVARQIAEQVKGQQYDLIYTGLESIDYNGGMICDLLGEMLGLPSAASVKSVELDNGTATFNRFIDGGSEKIKTSLPAVISSTKELAEPRIPNMRGIMQAKQKPLDVVEPVDTGVKTEFIEFEHPPEKGECQFIDPEEAEKLIDILHDQEKVI